jgi:AcrR family transcriptional regulator
MSSASRARSGARADDRTTKARIRDAAIDCFAELGVPGTTARKIAEAAGVSPGLVIHHFGSMDELRTTCDRYVAASIRRYKEEALAEGPNLDVLAALRDVNAGSLVGYLAAVLNDDSPTVARLVDDLVSDAEEYLEQGVRTGMIRPSPNPKGRAVVLVLWSLGALVLHRQVHRILGVDLTDPGFTDDPAVGAYVEPVYEIMSEGVVTEAFMTRMQAVLGGSDSTSRPGSKET